MSSVGVNLVSPFLIVREFLFLQFDFLLQKLEKPNGALFNIIAIHSLTLKALTHNFN